MTQPHVFVADWMMPDFVPEEQSLRGAGISWCLPSWAPPPPPREQQKIELLSRIKKAASIDAVLFQLAPLDAEVIDALPDGCRLLQRMGIGLDTVDLQAAARRGIPVRNTPNYCIEEVSTHAMAMLLSLHRQLASTQSEILAGRWPGRTPQPIDRMSRLTLGVLGLGRIGRRFAEIIRPMVKQVLFHDPAVKNPPDGMVAAEFEQLLCESDFISLHCPLLPETHHLINAETLKMLKPSAILLNVARGGLIDAMALADALNEERLAGAGLDVYEPEILPADSPLRTCKNIILTSHTAWYSRQASVDARSEAIQGILQAIS